MKKVVVTGGLGFIGQFTLDPLLQRGYEVHIITSNKHFVPRKGVIIHCADLFDPVATDTLLRTVRPTHMLHMAWYTENGKFWNAIENVYWLRASISLLESFYAAGGYRFVGLGTCAEYEWNESICVEDVTPQNPASLYGRVKKATRECLEAIGHSHGHNLAWARVFFPYGPGESIRRLVPYVVTSLLRNEVAKCTHGEQIRDFLYVADMGNALAAILDTEIAGAINVASGIPVSIKELVQKIASLLEKEHLVKFGAIVEAINSPNKILADVTKLTKTVGWLPELSLDAGISRVVNWWSHVGLKHLIRG